MSSRLRALPALAPLALAAAGAAWVHLASAVGPFDDAFITFRYVDNLLAGRGLVYNAGERVFGVSCPLYAGWLALLKLALPAADLPALAARGNLVFLIAAGALAHLLLRRIGLPRWAASAAGASVMVSEGILRASIGGMESSLFLALAFGSLLAAATRRDGAALALACLSALTRPEGLLLAAVVIAARLVSGGGQARGGARLAWLAGLLPLLAWIAGATIYFGTPIPHSVVAKARPLYPLPPGAALGHLAASMGRWTLDGALSAWMTLGQWTGGAAAAGRAVPRWLYQLAGAALTIWALTIWALALWWRGGPPALDARRHALPAFLAALVVFYALSNPLLLPWYMPLVQAPWIVLVAASMTASMPAGGMTRAGALARRAGLALVLGTAAFSFLYHVQPSERSLLEHGATDARQRGQLAAYERAAAWLMDHREAGATVAAPEIGVLGYRLDRRILDACGLVTPGALPFIPVPPDQRGAQLGPIPVAFVKAVKPDFVVTLPAFVEAGLLRSDWFASRYALVHEEPFLPAEPRYRAVLVFRRDDVAGLR